MKSANNEKQNKIKALYRKMEKETKKKKAESFYFFLLSLNPILPTNVYI